MPRIHGVDLHHRRIRGYSRNSYDSREVKLHLGHVTPEDGRSKFDFEYVDESVQPNFVVTPSPEITKTAIEEETFSVNMDKDQSFPYGMYQPEMTDVSQSKSSSRRIRKPKSSHIMEMHPQNRCKKKKQTHLQRPLLPESATAVVTQEREQSWDPGDSSGNTSTHHRLSSDDVTSTIHLHEQVGQCASLSVLSDRNGPSNMDNNEMRENSSSIFARDEETETGVVTKLSDTAQPIHRNEDDWLHKQTTDQCSCLYGRLNEQNANDSTRTHHTSSTDSIPHEQNESEHIHQQSDTGPNKWQYEPAYEMLLLDVKSKEDILTKSSNSHCSKVCLEMTRNQVFPQQLWRLTTLSHAEDNSSCLFSLQTTLLGSKQNMFPCIIQDSLEDIHVDHVQKHDHILEKIQDNPVCLIRRSFAGVDTFAFHASTVISNQNHFHVSSQDFIQSYITELAMKSVTCHQLIWEMILVEEILSRMHALKVTIIRETHLPCFSQRFLQCSCIDSNTIDWRLGFTFQHDIPHSILGTLRDLLHSHGELNAGPIPDSVVASLVLQLIEIMSILRIVGVAHNSLKLESFLVVRNYSEEKLTPNWSLVLVGLGHKGSILWDKENASEFSFSASTERSSSFYSHDLQQFGKIVRALLFNDFHSTALDQAGLFWSEVLQTISLLDTGVCLIADGVERFPSRMIDSLHHLASNDEMCFFLDKLYSYEMSERYPPGGIDPSISIQMKYNLHSLMNAL